MSGLVLNNVTKQFGAFTAVDNVHLSVPHGTFVCLLGPSGCGKTTLLRMIAGLEDPTNGTILLDGADITDVPTHKRNLGMVFQSLALFPHLSVGENIAYRCAFAGHLAKSRKSVSTNCSPSSICPAMATGRCRSYPVVNVNASLLPGLWRCRRRSSCSTSRSLRWTQSCAKPCKWSYGSFSKNSASPPSS